LPDDLGVGGLAGEVPDEPPGPEPFLVGGEGRGAYPDVGCSRVEVSPDPGSDGFLVADERQVGRVADALALEDGLVGRVADPPAESPRGARPGP
jgi:hypothetical protein